MSANKINKANFQQDIMKSGKTVQSDFRAPWCRPCCMEGPIVEQIVDQAMGARHGNAVLAML